MRSIFGLKVSLLFKRMFTLFLCFCYIFDKYEKPSLYFPYYGPFTAIKHNFPFRKIWCHIDGNNFVSNKDIVNVHNV